MFVTVIIVLLLIMAALGVGYHATNTEKSEGGGLLVAAVAIFLALCFAGWSMTATVDDGHVGVMQTFGKYSERTLEPGFQFKLPWQSVEEVDIRERAFYYGDSESDSGHQAGTKITAQAQGEGEIYYDATLQMAPSRDGVVELLREVGSDWFAVVGQSAARSCLRDAASTVTVSEALTTGRNDMAEATRICLVGEDGVSGKIGDNGIVVYGIDIRSVDTTPEIKIAINNAEAAERNILIAEDELAKAEIDGRTEAVEAYAISQAEQIVACGGTPIFDEDTGEAINVVAKEDEECDAPFSPAFLQWELIQALPHIEGAVYLPAGLDPANLIISPQAAAAPVE